MKPNRNRQLQVVMHLQMFLVMLFVLLYAGQHVALAAPGDIVTIAGGGAGDGNTALSVPLSGNAISYDMSGNMFVADCNANRVRKIDVSGVITTVAGIGGSGFSGDGGPAVEAALSCPSGVAADGSGNLFISDQYNHRIRKVTASGVIITVAGTGTAGFSGDGGPATAASINRPFGLAVDASGSLYFADYANNRVRKISNSGVITSVAGNGLTCCYSADGGNAVLASIYAPTAVAVDANGTIYIAATNNQRIHKVDLNGAISTLAGNGTAGYGGDNGPATSAMLYFPSGVHVDGAGNIYIADNNNHRVRKVNSAGVIGTVAGTGVSGYSGDGAAATAAKLNNPYAVTTDNYDNLVILDRYNSRIRMIDSSGIISTIAGNGTAGFFGEGVSATTASLLSPKGVVLDTSGNLYIADQNNHRVRKVDTNGVITTFAGDGSFGYSGDGGPASQAKLFGPYGVAADAGGNLCVADNMNSRIRKIDSTGMISTLAGTGIYGYSGDYGPATSANLSYVFHVAVNATENVFIADRDNHRIRKTDSSGIITTIAGTGVAGYSGDGGSAVSAQINAPFGIVLDAAGNIYFSETGNQRIRKIDTAGMITTIAGTGTAAYSGDGSAAIEASIKNPSGIALDTEGNLYFADSGNQRIRKIDTSGIISTVAGNGTYGFSGDNGPATSASLYNPSDVFVDTAGNILIADSSNNRIRKVIAAIPPTGSVVINSGAEYTNTASVVLTLSCTSHYGTCTEMQLSDNATTWSSPEAYATSKAWTLTSGDGTKRVYVKCKDDAGFWSHAFSDSIVLDTTPPAINIASPPAYSSSATPPLLISLSEGTVTAVKVDGVVVNKVSGSFLDALSEGTHTIQVEAVDVLGNAGFAERTFTVDTTAPTVTISSPQSGTTADSQPLLSYTASEGVVTVKLDGVIISKVSGNRLNTLTNGVHTVRVESRDAAGNLGFGEVSFTVDASAPITNLAEDFESGNLIKLPWAASGNGFWTAKTTTKHGGLYSAEAPVSIVDSQSASLEVPVTCVDGNVTFWYSVSSEANYDFLTFYVDGVQKGKWSGTVTWTQATVAVTAGTHTFKWVYSKDSSVSSGSDTAWVDDIVFPTVSSNPPPPTNTKNEGFETGTLNYLPLITSGNGLWTAKTTTRHSGTYAAEAPFSIIDNQSASMESTINCAAGTMSFWYSVSSELNYDYLRFFIDGVQKGQWSGSVGWNQISLPVTAGSHTFKWSYTKDGSVSSGSDTAWVDDIVIPIP